MNLKTILVMAIILIASITTVNAELIVSSVSVDGENVLISDADTVYTEQSLIVERGEEFDVKIRLYANTSAENIIVSTEILGYEFSQYENSLEDQTSTFDMRAGDTKFVTLHITIPDNVDKDQYDLRVRVASRKGLTEEYLVGLRLDGQRHSVIIKDIQIQDTVIAGRSILGNVRVKNIGQKTEESVKVTLSIPELGIEDSEYIDDLNEDDSTTSEDLLLRIPVCTKEGYYEVKAEIRYNDNYEKVVETKEIKVIKTELCEASSTTSTTPVEGETKTIITVPTGQEVRAGQSVVYPVVISNLGNTAKTYVLTVSPSAEAFGTYRIDPNNVMVINGQSTETAYVYLTIDKDAQTGLRDFKITVTADGESKDATLTASIVSGESQTSNVSDSLKTGLQISLLVLVVLLLILLIIFGFNKMKATKDDEEDEDGVGQTYY